ncbi:MAG: cytochrome C [Bacteroidota bacterium]
MRKQRSHKNRRKSITYFITTLGMILVLVLGATMYYILGEQNAVEDLTATATADVLPALLPEIKDGIHQPTGFVADKGLALVIANCTNCHSAKLVTQNRATREGWVGMIRWMQESQGLWDMGENEEVIVNYLTKHYAPTQQGRRRNLADIEWYPLDQE